MTDCSLANTSACNRAIGPLQSFYRAEPYVINDVQSHHLHIVEDGLESTTGTSTAHEHEISAKFIKQGDWRIRTLCNARTFAIGHDLGSRRGSNSRVTFGVSS
jgi:hypothetical protein